MPLYVYRCNDCCYEFEKLVSLREDQSAIHCPECEADVRRVITACAPLGGKRSEPALVQGGG